MLFKNANLFVNGAFQYGSFRVEDCYLITKDGAKRMTTYNDKSIPKIFKLKKIPSPMRKNPSLPAWQKNVVQPILLSK